jgi:hypothetical protein
MYVLFLSIFRARTCEPNETDAIFKFTILLYKSHLNDNQSQVMSL